MQRLIVLSETLFCPWPWKVLASLEGLVSEPSAEARMSTSASSAPECLRSLSSQISGRHTFANSNWR